jgi:hypothetical protein
LLELTVSTVNPALSNRLSGWTVEATKLCLYFKGSITEPDTKFLSFK